MRGMCCRRMSLLSLISIRWRVPVGLCALLVLVLAFCVVPAIASAEPLCTDSWAGPSEGEWTTAGDWSTGEVPGSASVACIASGKIVSISGGSNLVGVVEDEEIGRASCRERV